MAEGTTEFGDWGGLALAAGAGLALLVLVLFLRSKVKQEIGAPEIVFAILPIGIWLILGGYVSRLAFAGVELEAGQAILKASREPVENQLALIPGDLVREIAPEERAPKGSLDRIPELIERHTEALEFRLGRGGYYVGYAVRDYLTRLSEQSFFRYVVVFDERGGLFGLFLAQPLVADLRARKDPRGDGFDWFADALNTSDAEAREEIRALPGFVPGALAITPQTTKRDALAAMEENGVTLLPAVRPDRGFVGVVERDRLTTSLILDVTSSLEAVR